MKRKLTYFSTALVCCFLCIWMIVGGVIPAFAGERDYSLDYGIEGRDNNTAIDALTLYQKLSQKAPTAAEKLYLESAGVAMYYNSLVPDSRISTFYDGGAGTLDVELQPYVYTAANGETVTWIPQRARIDGKVFPLTEEGGVYRFRMEDVLYSADFSMEVDYLWQVEIPAVAVNDLLNSAYTEGQLAKTELAEWEAQMKAYNAVLQKHEAYVAYGQWEKDYAAYLIAKEVYRVKKEAYDAYVAKYNAYAAEKDAFDQWTAYFEYVDFKNNYLEDYNKYQTYLKALEPIKTRLAIMDLLFVSDSRGWQIYASVMGNTVTSVLNRKQELILAGGPQAEGMVNMAGAATEKLRALMSGYNDLRQASYPSEYVRIKTLYNYYAKNYIAIRDNFNDLYEALYWLYEEILAVRVYIKSQGKLEHYLQLVGELYVVSTCLDDTANRSADWRMSSQPLSRVVESLQILRDTNIANPANGEMPQEVPAVEWVEPMDEPTVPMPDSEPVPPPVVPDPGPAPTEVKDPSTTPRPEEVAHPGTAPASPVFSSLQKSLMQEIDRGTLKKKTEVSAPVAVSFASTVSRVVSISNKKSVTFYNWDGSVLYQTMVEYGGSIYYPLPDRADTAEYAYRKLAWVSVDGKDVVLSLVESDLSLYPLYEASKRSYTVTWVLDGEVTQSDFLYGTFPEPPMALTREDGPYHRYVFSGWDKEPVPVTGDVTYTGSIRQVPKDFNVTWVVNNGKTTVTEQWPYGSIPVFEGDLSVESTTHRYTFIAWDKTPNTVTGDVTYTAKYVSTPLAVGGTDEILNVPEDEEKLSVQATDTSLSIEGALAQAQEKEKAVEVIWENGVTLLLDAETVADWQEHSFRRVKLETVAGEGDVMEYRFHFYDNLWRDIKDVGLQMEVTLPYEKTDTYETVFFAPAAAARSSAEWVRLEGNVAQINGTTVLRREYAYRIKVVPNTMCNTMTMAKIAMAGDVVSLKLGAVFGYEVSGARVLCADGTEVEVKDLSFVMPASPVSVELIVSKIVYRVTFMVDGKVWSEAEYGLGDEILLPADPSKEAEEGYVYTFAGWGTVPAIASGAERELVFTASFAHSQDHIKHSSGNNDMLLTVVLPALLGVIVLVVLLVVFIKHRNKKELERLLRLRDAARAGRSYEEEELRIRRTRVRSHTPPPVRRESRGELRDRRIQREAEAAFERERAMRSASSATHPHATPARREETLPTEQKRETEAVKPAETVKKDPLAFLDEAPAANGSGLFGRSLESAFSHRHDGEESAQEDTAEKLQSAKEESVDALFAEDPSDAEE